MALRQLRQTLGKPLLFGIYGGIGCLLAAAFAGEMLLSLTKLPPQRQYLPQNIVLLIDTSDSMEGSKLQEVKTAASNFVDRFFSRQQRLQPSSQTTASTVAIVGFGSSAYVSSDLASNPATLKQAIAALTNNGGTQMELGFQQAIQVLTSTHQALPFSQQKPESILLFTDGLPNSQSASLSAATTARTRKINLIAVGTGDADQSFLSQLTGDPNRVFFANAGNFDQAFQQAEAVIAQAQLVDPEPGDYGLVYGPFRIGAWTGLLAAGIALALIVGQNHYLRRRWITTSELTLGLGGGLIAGLGAGALGELVFISASNLPILAAVPAVGSLVGWTILGLLVGGGMSRIVPNLPLSRALTGGGLGGVAGFCGFLLVTQISGPLAGRLVGASILGFAIGLMVALLESLAREAWLLVHWTPNEQTRLSLGQEPVLLGSSDRCHIYLPKSEGYPAVTAQVYLNHNKIIMDFDEQMRQLKGMQVLRHELKPGDRRRIGKVEFTVHATLKK